MIDRTDKIIEEARKVRLTAEEKGAIRNRIANFATQNPASSSSSAIESKKYPSRQYFSSDVFTWISIHHRYMVPALMVVIVFLGGGISIIAGRALPGDSLYPVKLNVNEKMESVLTFDTKQSALVELEQAARRLSEAEVLVENGTMTEERDTEIQQNFTKNVASMNSKIAQLEKNGRIDAANEVKGKFKEKLDEHEKTLNAYFAKSSATGGVLDVIRLARGERDGDNAVTMAVFAKEGADSARMARVDSDSELEDDENEYDDDSTAATATMMSITTISTTQSSTTTLATFTMAQVSTHNASTSCYTVIKGYVYDLTKWIKQHPGGSASILGLCGKDGTTSFEAMHAGQKNPESVLVTFKIGLIQK